jgi:hypothetical protein
MGTDGAISRGRWVRGMDSSARSVGGIKSTRIFGGRDGRGKRMKRYVFVCAQARKSNAKRVRLSFRVSVVLWTA